MFDNFTTLAHAAAWYTRELRLDDVADHDLPARGTKGHVVLISRCEPRLRKLIGRAARARAAERGDLEQAAILGFLEALARYDRERGVHPFTYAHGAIVKALQEANRAASPKPLQQKAHDRFWEAMKATDHDIAKAREWSRMKRLTGHALLAEADAGNRLAAEILDARIADCERKGQDVETMLATAERGLEPAAFDVVCAAVTYLDAPLAGAEADAGTYHDVIGAESPRSTYEQVEARAALTQMFDVLDARERAIVTGLYGVGGQPRTASDLADEYGLSRPRVLNIRRSALTKLSAVAA